MYIDISEIAPYIIVLVLSLAFFVFFIYMGVKSSKIKKQVKKEIQTMKGRLNAQESCLMTHVYGLDLPEDASCHVCICPDRFVFVRNQTDINLLYEKVTDVSIKTNTEIQTHYTSSAGGAVGGALLFGPLGAIIGGRTKKKKDISSTSYLIISYNKGEAVDHICFVVSNFSFAQKCVKAFQSSPSFLTKKTIDL